MKDMGAEMYTKIADSRRRKSARKAMLLHLCVGQPSTVVLIPAYFCLEK